MKTLYTLQFHYRLEKPTNEQALAGLIVSTQKSALIAHGFLHFFTYDDMERGRGLFILGADSRPALMLKLAHFMTNRELCSIWFAFIGSPFYFEYTLLQIDDDSDAYAEKFSDHINLELEADTLVNRFTRCESPKDLLPLLKLPE